jgi:hypothetical protein
MKSKIDLIRAWLRKARSDLAGAGLCVSAGEARYDEEFWPSGETARQALEAATTIRDFVMDRLPATTRPAEP